MAPINNRSPLEIAWRFSAMLEPVRYYLANRQFQHSLLNYDVLELDDRAFDWSGSLKFRYEYHLGRTLSTEVFQRPPSPAAGLDYTSGSSWQLRSSINSSKRTARRVRPVCRARASCWTARSSWTDGAHYSAFTSLAGRREIERPGIFSTRGRPRSAMRCWTRSTPGTPPAITR